MRLNSSISTAFWKIHGPGLTQTAIPYHQTSTALSKYIKDFHKTSTYIARKELDYSKSLKLLASIKPPVINGFDFISLIKANGEPHRGVLYFSDPDGDVSILNIEVVSHTGPVFTGLNKNIRDRLVSGNWYDGAIWFGFHCYEHQDVTVRMTLIDSKGNESNRVNLSFSCR